MQLRHIDCTPPPDFPKVSIILDPQKGFWIRVSDADGNTPSVHDGYFATLPGARSKARDLGHEPETWVDGSGIIHRF